MKIMALTKYNLSRFAGVSEAQAERESAGEILTLSLPKGKDLQMKDLRGEDGERGWIRTSDPRLKRALLYQLSYAPTLYQSNTFSNSITWTRGCFSIHTFRARWHQTTCCE